MHPNLVECLRCGEPHRLHETGLRYVQRGECPRCGYLGWAAPGELTERSRQMLRGRLLERPGLSLTA